MTLPRCLSAATASVAVQLLLLAPASALGASAPDEERTPLRLDAPAADPSGAAAPSGGSLVRTIVGLVIVVAVIYGISILLKRMKAGAGGRGARTRGEALEVAATVALGPNRALHLVRVGDEHVLVGAAEQGVVPIRTYSAAEARDAGIVADPDPVDLDLDLDGDDHAAEGPAVLEGVARPAGPAPSLGAALRRALPAGGAARSGRPALTAGRTRTRTRGASPAPTRRAPAAPTRDGGAPGTPVERLRRLTVRS